MPKPLKNSWYEIQNSASGVSIVIEDEIGAWGVSASQFRSDFGRIGKNETVSLHIKSGGGSVFEGNEIANILRGHEGPVNVTLGSICASIATVIMCAGAKVTAAKNTLVMIHNPEVYAGGDSSDLRKLADIMDKMKKGIVAAYVAKTGKSAEECAAAMDEETWMDAAEARAFGFVNEISEEDAEDEVADHVDLRHYRNSSTLISRLQPKPGATGATAGNGERLSLHAIRNAAANPPPQKTPVTPPTNMKTAEETAAEKAEIARLAKEEAQNIVKAQNARAKEIRAMVAQVAKRDKKDFSALAEDFINRDQTVEQFAVAMMNTDTFTAVKEQVGSGIQVIEPMDRFKGTPGFQFVNSDQGKQFFEVWKNRGRHNFSLTLAVPADFVNATQTSSSPNQLTSIEYKPGVAMLGVRALRIKQIIPGGSTSSTTIRGRREDAFTDDATSVTEVGALPNLAFSVAEVDYPVKDLGGYVEVSENLMSDYEAVMSLINQRLPYKVERVTDYQLLSGGGTGADLTGILSTSGIQTQAKGADTAVDAIFKAKTLVENVPNATQANAGGGYNTDFGVINPTDWQNIRLSKDANAQYYGGGPFTGAYGVGAGFSNVEMLWGIPFVRTTAIAAGTALVGAFAECAQWFQRQGLVIEMTNSNGTNFINRIVTIRGAERLALTVDQPNGFCQITGL